MGDIPNVSNLTLWPREHQQHADQEWDCVEPYVLVVSNSTMTLDDLNKHFGRGIPDIIISAPGPDGIWAVEFALKRWTPEEVVVEVAVPLVSTSRHDRVYEYWSAITHEPPLMLALPKQIQDETGRVLSRFQYFAQLVPHIEQEKFGYFVLLDYEPGEEIDQFIKSMNNCKWEGLLS